MHFFNIALGKVSLNHPSTAIFMVALFMILLNTGHLIKLCDIVNTLEFKCSVFLIIGIAISL